MTNGQKYKTAEERVKAFGEFCKNEFCDQCNHLDCKLHKQGSEILRCYDWWLALEFEDEIEPCPFCGEKCELHEIWDNEMNRSAGFDVRCTMCRYRSPEASQYDGSDAIAAHNRVARAVRAANGSEVKHGK